LGRTPLETVCVLSPTVILRYSEGSSLELKGPFAIQRPLKHQLSKSDKINPNANRQKINKLEENAGLDDFNIRKNRLVLT